MENRTVHLNIERLTRKTIGRRLSIYDTWNGSSVSIHIEKAVLSSQGVFFTGTNSWGGKSGIYVDKEFLKTLIENGEAVKHNEIDHCDVRTKWSLN